MLFVEILISIAQAELRTNPFFFFFVFSSISALSYVYTFILVVHRVIYEFHLGGMRFIISLNLDYYCLILCVCVFLCVNR